MAEPVPQASYGDEFIKRRILGLTEDELHRSALDMIARLPPEGPRGVLTDRQRDYYRQMLAAGQLPGATRDEVGNPIERGVLGAAGRLPTFSRPPAEAGGGGASDNWITGKPQPVTPPAQIVIDPRNTQLPSSTALQQQAQQQQQSAEEYYSKLTPQQIADELAAKLNSPEGLPKNAEGNALFHRGLALLESGRLTLVKDPVTGRRTFVVSATGTVIPVAVMISDAVLREAIIDLAKRLAAEANFTGLEDKQFPDSPEHWGRILLGGVIGAGRQDLPGGQVPPSRQPRQPVDEKGNVKPRQPFPDDLFRRNPPDP